jgi:hypothetical protein
VFATPSWNFAALLASPGFAVLLPTERHADVAEEVILELPHLKSAPRRAHGHLTREHDIGRICTREFLLAAQ